MCSCRTRDESFAPRFHGLVPPAGEEPPANAAGGRTGGSPSSATFLPLLPLLPLCPSFCPFAPYCPFFPPAEAPRLPGSRALRLAPALEGTGKRTEEGFLLAPVPLPRAPFLFLLLSVSQTADYGEAANRLAVRLPGCTAMEAATWLVLAILAALLLGKPERRRLVLALGGYVVVCVWYQYRRLLRYCGRIPPTPEKRVGGKEGKKLKLSARRSSV